MNKPLVVIITGLSGAGLSTALNVLQDSGFYCVDNLPIEMLEDLMKLVLDGQIQARGYAFCMDVRTKRFAEKFPKLVERLKNSFRIQVVYLNCSEAVLMNRYSSTRRRHPLIGPEGDLQAAIRREAALLKPLSESADVVFDSTSWSPHVLARMMEMQFQDDLVPRKLYLTLISFGFKHGDPPVAENVVDVRYLPNPFFVQNLRDLDGRDPQVREFIFREALTQESTQKLEELYRFLVRNYFEEGKHYVRFAIGCTGGKHRSVCLVEHFAKVFRDTPVPNVVVNTFHRDLASKPDKVATSKRWHDDV